MAAPPITLRFLAQVLGLLGGTRTIQAEWPINLPLPVAEQRTMLSGDNLVFWPAGSTVCVVLLPAGETITVTLKGVITDTGNLLVNNQPIVLSKGSDANFVLTTSGVPTNQFVFYWL